jgi:hypothetical protein
MEKGRVVGIALLLLLGLSGLPYHVAADAPTTGNITFMPNVIPELQIHFVEEFFRFEWRNNTFDLKLSIHMSSGKSHSLRDFWEATDRVVKWQNMCRRATASMYEFGYTIEDIPQGIADKVEFLLWKIEGASFDVSDIEVDVIEDPELEYNITRFHLPDNLVLSYEDLWLYNYTVSHPSKLETKVEGVKGKTAWNLDPITYSEPTILVVGFSSETPCTFWDLWNASDGNGWNVVWRQNNSYTTRGVQVYVGNGTETWYADENLQIQIFPSTVISRFFWVKDNAHFQFGTVKNESSKITSNGVSVKSKNCYDIIRSDVGSDVLIYDSYIAEIGDDYDSGFWINGNLTIWNSKFSKIWGLDIEGITDLFDVEFQDIYGHYFDDPRITMDSVKVMSATDYFAEFGDLSQDVCMSNFYGRNAPETFYLAYTNGYDLYMIDADVDNWNPSFSSAQDTKLFRQYTFDLTFTFDNGSYAEGTNVTISNDYLDYSHSWILSSNGSIPQQTYSMGHYNQTGGDTLYDYNPYTITATLDGYDTYTSNVNITEATDLTISLIAEAKTDPIARFTYSPSNPGINNAITFSASDSVDPDGGSLASYSWTFGDGTSDTGETVTKAYTDPNIYSVSLTVTDDEAATDTFSLNVKVDSPGGITIPPLPDDKREKDVIYIPQEEVLLTRKDGNLVFLVLCVGFVALGFSWRVWDRRRKKIMNRLRDEWRKREREVWD